MDIGARVEFYQKILKISGESILISGDIAEAPSLIDLLEEMER